MFKNVSQDRIFGGIDKFSVKGDLIVVGIKVAQIRGALKNHNVYGVEMIFKNKTSRPHSESQIGKDLFDQIF